MYQSIPLERPQCFLLRSDTILCNLKTLQHLIRKKIAKVDRYNSFFAFNVGLKIPNFALYAI